MAKKVDIPTTDGAEVTEKTEAPLYVPAEDQIPSLNQLAIVLGIPAVRLQSAQVAYKPIEGEPYTAKKINWPSVSAFIARRLDKTGYTSVEEVYAAAVATDYTPKRATREKDPNSVYGKVLFGTTPLRKGHVELGTKIHNRKTNEDDTVVYVDDTIVVFQPEHVDGEQVLSNSIGNRMFNMNYDIVKVD